MTAAQEPPWGEECPDCGGKFPFLYGRHPTWVRCFYDPAVESGVSDPTEGSA